MFRQHGSSHEDRETTRIRRDHKRHARQESQACPTPDIPCLMLSARALCSCAPSASAPRPRCPLGTGDATLQCPACGARRRMRACLRLRLALPALAFLRRPGPREPLDAAPRQRPRAQRPEEASAGQWCPPGARRPARAAARRQHMLRARKRALTWRTGRCGRRWGTGKAWSRGACGRSLRGAVNRIATALRILYPAVQFWACLYLKPCSAG